MCPCFFVSKTPMLYVCWQKHNGSLIALEIDIAVADREGVKFSDGNVAASESRIYSDPKDLEKLDWEVILSPYPAYWKNWKRKRSAEVLVSETVPKEYIQVIHFPREWMGKLTKEKMQLLDVQQIRFRFDLTQEGVL